MNVVSEPVHLWEQASRAAPPGSAERPGSASQNNKLQPSGGGSWLGETHEIN